MKAHLEIHFVHQSEDKSLAVIAVMVNEGEANPALAPVVEKKTHRWTKRKNWLNRLIFKR